MMFLKPMDRQYTAFVYTCLKELRGSVDYSFADFEAFIEKYEVIKHPAYQIFIGFIDCKPVGVLTCNRFIMPRYLGFGYELEEVIIHPSMQGKNYGGQLIAGFIKLVKEDKSIRKIIVKTDDQQQAGKLYKRYFDINEATVYVRKVNNL